MSPAQLYRPSPKWPIAAAFTFAAIIHLSMVALASLHRELPPAPFIDDVPAVGGEDVPPESIPELESLPAEENAPPPADHDFVDTPTPPTHRIRRPQAGDNRNANVRRGATAEAPAPKGAHRRAIENRVACASFTLAGASL